MSFELMYYDCDRGDVLEIHSFCIFPTPRLSKKNYDINACAYICKICEECAKYSQRIKNNYLYDDPVNIIYGEVSKDVAIIHESSLIFVSIPEMYECERCRTSTSFNIQYNTRTHNYVVEYENFEGPQPVNYHVQPLSKNYSDCEGNLEVYIIYVQGIGPLFCLTNGKVILYLPSVSIIKPRYPGWHSIIKMATGGTFSVFKGPDRGKYIVLDNLGNEIPYNTYNIVHELQNKDSAGKFFSNIYAFTGDPTNQIIIHGCYDRAEKFAPGKHTKAALQTLD